MKKYKTIVISIVCILMLAGCNQGVETMYIESIMVDGILYEKACAMPAEIDESAIIGYVESYTDTIPEKNGETNISKDLIGSPYAKVEDSIALLYENEWYLCTAETPSQDCFNASVLEVVTEGAEITVIKHEPAEKPDWGINLTVENITPAGLTIVCSQSDVDVNGELVTGSHYALSKYEDGEWKELEYLPQKYQIAWTDEGWSIPLNDVVKWDVDWEYLYGKLKTGTYRISKSIMNTAPGTLETATYDVKFDIK